MEKVCEFVYVAVENGRQIIDIAVFFALFFILFCSCTMNVCVMMFTQIGLLNSKRKSLSVAE